MPQAPIPTQNVVYPKAKSLLNITVATLIKAGTGTILSVGVTVAGSGAGAINDAATLAGVAAGNKIASIPTTAGPLAGVGGFPFTNGLVLTPGTGQTLTVAFQ